MPSKRQLNASNIVGTTDVEEIPFPVSEYKNRLNSVQSRLRDHEIDALLVTTPENIYYLTGYDTTGYYSYTGLVVPQEGEPQFVVRLLESSNVEVGSWAKKRKEYTDSHKGEKSVETIGGIDATVVLFEEMGLSNSKVGFEEDSWFLTHRQLNRLRRNFDGSLIGVTGIVDRERIIKSELELEYMREAGEILEDAMYVGLDAIEEGVNENLPVAEIQYELTTNNSGHTGTQIYQASGLRSGITHTRWKGRTIKGGDIYFLEVGSARRRYHTALMATAYVGTPSELEKRTADVCFSSIESALEKIEPGVKASEVDKAARDVWEEADYINPARTGYSIGIAFPPCWGEGHLASLGPGDETVLRENMTFHIPINFYDERYGSIGHSVTVRVTAGGYELLADIDRELYLV
jgi:Xaa-Pro dipeptidase